MKVTAEMFMLGIISTFCIRWGWNYMKPGKNDLSRSGSFALGTIGFISLIAWIIVHFNN